MTSLYPIPLTLNDGTTTDFGMFKGKVVMVVNVASNCGFTPQYAGLETLYEKFRDRGFEILGVPCNQFAGQEPGSDSEIAEFCQRNFGVSFPLTAKADVRGRGQHPLYAELTKFKTRTKADLFRAMRDNQALANALANEHRLYGDWRELFRYLDRIDKVTKADIRRVANATFQKNNRTVAMSNTRAAATKESTR